MIPRGYVYELEQEVERVHRRSLLPIWVAAFFIALFCLFATLHQTHPRQVEPFVGVAR